MYYYFLQFRTLSYNLSSSRNERLFQSLCEHISPTILYNYYYYFVSRVDCKYILSLFLHIITCKFKI